MTAHKDQAVSERIIEHARLLYQNLSRELTRAIEGTRPDEDSADAKARYETLRAHRKALQTVLDFELQLARDDDRDGAGALDLAAARDEVLGRLDRLVSARGDRELA